MTCCVENREPLQLELKNYSKITTLFTVLMMYMNYTLLLLVPSLTPEEVSTFNLRVHRVQNSGVSTDSVMVPVKEVYNSYTSLVQ